MNTKSTCPPCRRGLFLHCEIEKSGYALRSIKQSNFRSLGFECGQFTQQFFDFSTIQKALLILRDLHPPFLLSFLFGKQPPRHLPKLLASVAEIGNLKRPECRPARRFGCFAADAFLLLFALCQAPIWASRK